ncbi:uncharacterized protein MONBRDRAFT_35510 [Monosiga brevicollis MX1]|uniref:BHLH domain-containing protein n=1 Tax=Monosiga brevicollis TaxID=81824 RepID=A9UPJ6_MONBE|nr:uncharacterized protein MONBRDRAFT_35510 [Monosiga brevicollis MX1]EDQ92435.1 predicted protein [Monosiga brevicollis MX1]|eukprot:XP_001742197.1 hypothetical protein [Monosiga brevicollis MX1]
MTGSAPSSRRKTISTATLDLRRRKHKQTELVRRQRITSAVQGFRELLGLKREEQAQVLELAVARLTQHISFHDKLLESHPELAALMPEEVTVALPSSEMLGTSSEAGDSEDMDAAGHPSDVEDNEDDANAVPSSTPTPTRNLNRQRSPIPQHSDVRPSVDVLNPLALLATTATERLGTTFNRPSLAQLAGKTPLSPRSISSGHDSEAER